MVKLTSKRILDAMNKYVYIVPSLKEAILKELGLVYNRKEDTWTQLDARRNRSEFLDYTDYQESSEESE